MHDAISGKRTILSVLFSRNNKPDGTPCAQDASFWEDFCNAVPDKNDQALNLPISVVREEIRNILLAIPGVVSARMHNDKTSSPFIAVAVNDVSVLNDRLLPDNLKGYAIRAYLVTSDWLQRQ